MKVIRPITGAYSAKNVDIEDFFKRLKCQLCSMLCTQCRYSNYKITA